MSRFRGTVLGRTKAASRLGTKESGLEVTCRGWEEGVRVVARVNNYGADAFDIYLTGPNSRLLATLCEGKLAFHTRGI